MAGIILDINDDIKRLQQLKAEIESVKKALTSINVKVDIDIAKGLEVRLQKLMGQYDALVGKIAASEAKVKEAESRMNSATQRIMEAQERMAQAATGQGTNTSKSGNTTATNAQTASIKEQARAYDDLKNTVATFLGTVEDNAKFISETSIRIKAITANISTLNNVIKTQGHASVEQIEQLAAWNKELAELKLRAQDARRELNTGLRINIAGKGTLKELQNQLLQLQRVWENMTEDRRISPIGQQLAASIEMMNKQVSELEQTMGRYQRNVGNYASGFNSLGMSVQQIVRELPAATMGLNMFFLAISNNLPILTDEIKRAAEANKALKAQNQETIPVWKQLVSSIFSWQTALIVAITAMSMYGKEIVSWIGNLFKAKDATEEVRIEQEKLNKSMADARKSAAEETAGLRTLYSMTQNQNASMQDRLAAVNKLQQQYPAYFGNISKEAILAGQASAAYQQLTKDIMAAAYARAYQDRISDLAAKNIDNYNKSLSQYNYLKPRQGAYDAAMQREERRAQLRELMDKEGLVWRSEYADEWAELRKLQDGDRTLIKQFNRHHELWENANKDYQRIEKSIEGYQSQALKYQNALMKTEQGSDYVEDTKSQENEAKRIAKERERIAKERLKAQSDVDKDLLSLQQKNQDDEIALMRDGTEKKIAEIDNDYKKRIAEIERQEAEFKEKNKEAGLQGLSADGLTSDQSKALEEARNNAEKKRHTDTQKLLSDENKARVTALQDYLKSYGDYEQKRLAITQEYQQKIADAETSGERLNLQAQLEDALSELDFNQFKDKMDWEAIFGDLGDLTIEQLKAIREQLRGMLTDGDMGIEDYKTAVEQIDKVNDAIVSKQDEMKSALGLILPMQQQRKELELEVEEAQRRETELLKEQAEIQDRLDSQRGNIAGTLKDVGINISASDVTTANMDAVMEQIGGLFGNDSDIYKNVQKQFDELGKSERELNTTTKKLDKAQSDVTMTTSRLNTFLNNLGNKLQAISEAMQLVNSNMQSLPDLFSQLGVDMDGELGKGITDLAAASQYASSAIQDAMGGNFVGALSNGVGAVKGVLSGFNNIFGLGIGKGNAKETAEKIERLTESNDYLRTSIDRLTEKMDGAAGGRAIGYYEKAKEAQGRYNENLRQILDAQMRYTAAHHSNAYYWNLDRDSLKQVNALLGTNLANEWTDFSKLTPEQMDEIRTMLPDVWEEMINEGKYGDRFREDWENYADQAGKVEELTEQIRDNLMQTSFDSLRSSFLDTLMDMDADAEDFADNFSEMMQRALLNFAMGDLLDDKLKEWYENLADDIGESGGDWSSIDIGKYRDEWQAMADEWLGVRDAISEITGYTGNASDSGQQASSKGYEVASQESVDYTNGRLNAIYEAELRIEAQGEAKGQSLADLKGSVAEIAIQAQGLYGIADETRSILANSYLELQEIRENTAEIVKPIKKMQKDIEQVKQNTSKL